ncbi:syntaxin 1.4 [Trichoplax adhaerens]|uniref:Syntaxin 1.4 n=1 Tax=Trichoplax adhaerens TaxID=10228 RepID=B3RZQ2_TRIAD|nr:syntaxin 1.4 [Trichoplax adhaerens]EDV24244.1 syntaxin 1.4 [Trichoplax adhaerens]|eukprot:XP_002113770.1 syntaxin 1.4 [Trichoplax adhaerens]
MKDRMIEIQAVQANQDDEELDDKGIEISIEEPVPFMEDFFNQVEHIEGELDTIEDNLAQVAKAYSDFITMPKVTEDKRESLEKNMENIKIKAKRIRSQLKGLEATIGQDDHSAEFRIKQTQVTALSNRLVSLMSDYNTMQVEHREKCKARIVRQLEITGKTTTDDEVEEMLEQGDLNVFTDGMMIDSKEAKKALEAIEQRYDDIMKLEKSIKELHDMFLDMAMLVESQGEMLDNIEHNTLSTVDYVQRATTDLSKAHTYQTAARKKLICIIVLVIILLIIITVAIVVPTVNNSSNNSGNSNPSTQSP